MPFGMMHSIQKKLLEDRTTKEKPSSNSVYLDFRCMPGNKLLMIPEATSASSRGPQTPKCSVFPSPSSQSSAVFDSPQKSSPSSSSVSFSNTPAVAPRVKTPIAELEDTSSAFICPELEDTSACAVQSSRLVNNSQYNLRSNNIIVGQEFSIFSFGKADGFEMASKFCYEQNSYCFYRLKSGVNVALPKTRSLVNSVDLRFADYEAEIRFLRKSLANAEKSLRDVRTSLREAKKAADDSSQALDVAQEAIADREYQLEVKESVITELEKDVKHCHAHHPPPKPPSKLRSSGVAISRFNVDVIYTPKPSETAKSPKHLSPSTNKYTFDASPKKGGEYSSPISPTKTTRLTLVSRSGNPSPLIGDCLSPHARPKSQGRRTSQPTQPTAETVAAAHSSAASSPKPLETASSDGQFPDGPHSPNACHERVSAETCNGAVVLVAQKSHLRGRRKRQSSVSTPNLRGVQNSSPQSELPALPPRPPMMSGGLGIVGVPVDEIQQQKLQRKKGGLSEIFRRKDNARDQAVIFLDDKVHGVEYGAF